MIVRNYFSNLYYFFQYSISTYQLIVCVCMHMCRHSQELSKKVLEVYPSRLHWLLPTYTQKAKGTQHRSFPFPGAHQPPRERDENTTRVFDKTSNIKTLIHTTGQSARYQNYNLSTEGKKKGTLLLL